MNPAEVIANRYELGRLLGRGGMADVYLATDLRLNRKVAVKMLHRNLCSDEDLLARFRREAGASARLNHPSIVQVYDSGGQVEEDITLPYIVMEYIPGRTLRDVLNENRLSGRGFDPEFVVDPQQTKLAGSTTTGDADAGSQRLAAPRTRPLAIHQAVSLTSGVLMALAYSHRHGVVHRDIKPGNVMVSELGEVKVMDFGIARAATEATAAMTRTNAVVGTASYMSPEQATGETVDARSDLYSAGCLLYELLTGRPPFMSETAVSLAYKHVGERPMPPSHFNPEVPELLERVVLKALAKDRRQRYQDADSFRADLLAAEAGRPVDAPPLPPPGSDSTESMTSVTQQDIAPVGSGPVAARSGRRRRMVALLTVLALVMAAAGAGGWYLYRHRGPTTVAVPDVVGDTLSQAEQKLRKAGFTPAQGRKVASDEVAKGNVVSQSPQSRLLEPKGSTVTITVSGGPAQVTVPDVSGKTQKEARAALAKAGLSPANANTANSVAIASGRVISTSPGAGSPVLRGSPVDLTLSSGLVDLSDLSGYTLGDARSWLRDHGLKASVEYRDSESTPGTVVGQSPGASSVQQGSTVSLAIAKEPAAAPSSSTPPAPSPSSPTSAAPSSSPTTSSPSASPSSSDGRTWPSSPSASSPWPPTPSASGT